MKLMPKNLIVICFLVDDSVFQKVQQYQLFLVGDIALNIESCRQLSNLQTDKQIKRKMKRPTAPSYKHHCTNIIVFQCIWVHTATHCIFNTNYESALRKKGPILKDSGDQQSESQNIMLIHSRKLQPGITL